MNSKADGIRTAITGCRVALEQYRDAIEKYSGKYHIEKIHDRFISEENSELNGIPVVPEECEYGCYDMVIVVGDDWKSQIKNLFEEGMLPFRDFVTDWFLDLCSATHVISYSQLKTLCEKRNDDIEDYLCFVSYGKKLAVVYGNCQVPYIVRFLSRTVEFRNEYFMLSLPPIQSLKEEKKMGLPKNLIKRIDLFIYQMIKEDNRFSPRLSSAVILEQLSRKCRKVAIPNVFWKGYFPQLGKNPYNPYVGSEYNWEGIFPYGDTNIMKMSEDYGGDIFNEIKREDFYQSKDVISCAYESMKELKKREESCDIAISDFIEKNFRKKKLFYVPNHPTNFVVEELARRILNYLGFRNYHMDTRGIPENDNLAVPIYPSVAIALKLEFDCEKICFCKKFDNTPVDLRGYVENYLKYCVKGNVGNEKGRI